MASQTLGSYAFLIGVLLAVILGIVAGVMPSVLSNTTGLILLVLIILGLLVGLLNIKDEHISEFLIAVIAVTMIGSITVQQSVQLTQSAGTIVSMVFQNIVAFSAPSALVVGLKQIWNLAYTKSRK
ncbi:MAG: hypothetical protein WC462_04540 [archaeon]